MDPVLLLVTWIVAAQPPNSYQTAFDSVDACRAARDAVLKDAERIGKEIAERDFQEAARPGVIRGPNTPKPSVSAVCVTR